MESEKVAENCEKLATDSQSQKASGGARRDEAQLGTRADLFVDHFLRIIQAAAALHFAAMAGVSRLRRARAGTSRLADFALRDPIADADDHGALCNDNANHSQVKD